MSFANPRVAKYNEHKKDNMNGYIRRGHRPRRPSSSLQPLPHPTAVFRPPIPPLPYRLHPIPLPTLPPAPRLWRRAMMARRTLAYKPALLLLILRPRPCCSSAALKLVCFRLDHQVSVKSSQFQGFVARLCRPADRAVERRPAVGAKCFL